MNNPFFSVLIPTYNRSSYLKEAIQSVLDQTFEDYEIIVIDDSSTDQTQDVVSSFRDKRIRYTVNDHLKGQPGARNAGLAKAKGIWVAFLDDDDIWLSKKLEYFYIKIQEVDKSVGIVYSAGSEFDFEKRKELKQFIPKKQGWIQNDLLYKNYIGPTSLVAVKTELLNKAGGFDERFPSMVDLDMWVRIAGLAKVIFIRDKLAYIRTSNMDRISLNLQTPLQSSLLFWEKYKTIINRNYRLHYRAASRVFEFALTARNKKYVFKSLPWTIGGLFFDLSNTLILFRLFILFLLGKKYNNRDGV